MTDSLFTDDQSDQPQIDESQTYYDKLVGANAKFKDNESLAKGKWYADAQIEIQNRKMDQMRQQYLELKADYDARAKLEDYLDQLQNKPQDTQSNEKPEVKESNAPAIKPEDIDARFRHLREEEKSQQNLDTVMGKLREQYGQNWQSALKQKTEELGLTATEVDAMARRSPKLFFKTMDLEQPQPQKDTFHAPPKNDQRFQPQGAHKKTWSYYQELYKKDPKLYYDPKLTQEMVESHAQLGRDFEDGDFRKYGDTVGSNINI